jgi:hypothetical protein
MNKDGLTLLIFVLHLITQNGSGELDIKNGQNLRKEEDLRKKYIKNRLKGMKSVR